MCLERVHRFLMAGVIGLAATLLTIGFGAGIYLVWFVVAMLIVWGATNFCPSVWMMKKTGLKPCRFGS